MPTTKKTQWSDALILGTVRSHGLMTPEAQERAYELVDAGYIDAAGTWKLTDAGHRLADTENWG
jgi:hypothetical protein